MARPCGALRGPLSAGYPRRIRDPFAVDRVVAPVRWPCGECCYFCTVARFVSRNIIASGPRAGQPGALPATRAEPRRPFGMLDINLRAGGASAALRTFPGPTAECTKAESAGCINPGIVDELLGHPGLALPFVSFFLLPHSKTPFSPTGRRALNYPIGGVPIG
eukprot:gene1071-biopygen7701